MKVIRIGNLITFILVLSITLGLITVTKIEAAGKALIYLSSPTEVYQGGKFIVKVNISGVTNLHAFQMQLNYDDTEIQIIGSEGEPEGVTAGLVGDNPVEIDFWSFYSSAQSGKNIRIGGRLTNNQMVTGSGYLAEIHFRAIGPVGTSSAVAPIEEKRFLNGLFDNRGDEIESVSPWSGCSFEVIYPLSLGITSHSLPAGVTGGLYTATLTAQGGYYPYKWQAEGLPAGLSISEEGIISGRTTYSGDSWTKITVTDDQTPPDNVTSLLLLSTYSPGDANEDRKVSKADVEKVIRIYLGLDNLTPAADVNGDGSINLIDALKIKKMYLSQ